MNTKSRSLLAFSLCAGASLLQVGLVQAQVKAAPALPAPSRHPTLPYPQVPGALGVNIHFTDAQPGELEMLKEGGFRVVRMDFAWGGTEKAKGIYDFSAYDRLLKGLEAQKLQPLFILDYSNPLYDEGLSPYTDAGRTAFANWAGAAAAHFKGHRVLWEMYNEPNIGFWKPSPNPGNYVKLALATGKAIQRDAPGECYIGPGSSGVDMDFLEACFKGGLLSLWDGVSVHPYRQDIPETASNDYRRLRLMIERYKPKGKTIPILSGEWGYSSAWNNYNDERQGKYLPREWMTNLMNGVPVSIWYDWHDDGTDPKEPEHHFGTTNNQYFAGRTPVYDPKPSYTAARTLTQQLDGFYFNKRLALDSPDDYLFVFTKNLPSSKRLHSGPPLLGDFIPKLAVWTTGEPHEITVPASAGTFKVVGYLGQAQPDAQSTAQGLKLRITDTPLYLEPIQNNTLLQQISAWQSVLLEYPVTAPATLPLENNGPKMTFRRDSSPADMRISQQFGPHKVTQVTQTIVANPLSLVVEPTANNQLQVTLENPAEAATAGQVTLNGANPQSLNFTDKEKQFTVPMPAPAADGSRMVKVRFTGKNADDFVESSNRFVPLKAFAALTPANLATALIARPDGDAAIESEQIITVAQNAPETAPGGGPVLKLAYRFAPGWKFANIQPLNNTWATIEGQPKRLGMWVYGDNSNHQFRMRFSDSTGQTFQPGGTPLNWKGWRYYSFPLDNSSGHWGGANDGQIHGAIKIESLFLLDSANRAGGQGEIYVSAPSWIY